MLLFAGLFLGYTVYRHFYHDAFHHCSRALDITYGTINTLVLITSSLFCRARLLGCQGREDQARAGPCWSSRWMCGPASSHQVPRVLAQVPRRRAPRQMVHQHGADEVSGGEPLLHHLLPDHRPARVSRHRRHVGADLGDKGDLEGGYTPDYYVPVELGALYWHLVDLVWIFLFPLLYLIDGDPRWQTQRHRPRIRRPGIATTVRSATSSSGASCSSARSSPS